jgi:hypothetical protein
MTQLKGSQMHWKIEEAQQRFSELIGAVVSEPQLIYDRDRIVAAFVEAKIFQEFLSWYQQQHKSSLADAFTQLRQICVEEDYIFDLPPRLDRPNDFTENLHDISL